MNSREFLGDINPSNFSNNWAPPHALAGGESAQAAGSMPGSGTIEAKLHIY